MTTDLISSSFTLVIKTLLCFAVGESKVILFYIMILLLAVVHGVGSYPTKRNPVSQPKLKTPEGHDSRRRSSIVVIPETVEDLQQNPGISDLDIFKYEEMKMATKHFRPKQVLGEGGFGIVYKGVIDEHVRPGYKTTYVAIKELDPEGLQGDREWLVGATASCLVNNLIVYLRLDSGFHRCGVQTWHFIFEQCHYNL